MVKPFDLSSLTKALSKKHKIKSGFSNPTTWISTGNYGLNKMISGDFHRGIPLGAVTVFAGESGSAKSYIVSGNIVKDALAQGINVVIFDTEDALKEQWMRNLGVDPDHPLLTKFTVNTVNELGIFIKEFVAGITDNFGELPLSEQPKMLFVVDSLGFLETDVAVDQFDKGDMKGDKGIKAKMLKSLVSHCIRLFTGTEIGLVATNHTYKSQDMYNPDDVISGGGGFIFAASIIVSMNKKKLKADEEKPLPGEKKSKAKPAIAGIKSKIKCVKTRYSKPFEEIEVDIPYSSGMNIYSGLFEMFEKGGLLVREGNSYVYTEVNGTVHKKMRNKMDNDFFDMIIEQFDEKTKIDKSKIGFDEVEYEGDEDVE